MAHPANHLEIEHHLIHALDEELIFVGFLQGAPGNISEKRGGELGRKRN